MRTVDFTGHEEHEKIRHEDHEEKKNTFVIFVADLSSRSRLTVSQ